jgi:hypothetical protein
MVLPFDRWNVPPVFRHRPSRTDVWLTAGVAQATRSAWPAIAQSSARKTERVAGRS